jgi:hypothetical protein
VSENHRNIYYKIVRSTICPSWINLLLSNITTLPNQFFGKIKNDDIFGGPQTVQSRIQDVIDCNKRRFNRFLDRYILEVTVIKNLLLSYNNRWVYHDRFFV